MLVDIGAEELLRNGRVVWDCVELGVCRLSGIEIRCRVRRS